MTNYIKKLLALVVVAGAMTAVATAPTPVATWTDFSSFTPGTALSLTSEEGNHHLSIPANAQLADDGALVVGGNGFDIDYSGTKIVTVELDVADCPTDGKVLMRVLVGGNAMCLESVSDGNLYQRWTTNMSTDWNHAAWEPSERQTITVAYSGPDSPTPTGTQTFRNGEEFITANAGLRSSSTNISSLGIGYQYGTTKLATGLKVYGIRVYSTRLTAEEVAEAYEEHKPQPPVEDGATPVLLANMYNGGTNPAAEPVVGWINNTQNDNSSQIPKTAEWGSDHITSDAGISFQVTGGGNFFNGYSPVSTDFATDGNYVDIFGGTHTTIAEEVATSLGLPEGTVFDASVYKTGIVNGGAGGHTATISNLDPEKLYVVYAGMGLNKQNQTQGFKIEESGYGSVGALDYVVSTTGGNTTAANQYQSFAAGTVINASASGVMIVRLSDITSKADGTIVFNLASTRACLNFLAVAEVTRNTPTKLSTTLTEDKSWSELTWTADGKTQKWIDGVTAEIEVTDEVTLTLDPMVDVKTIKFTGSYPLTLTTADGTKPAAEFLAKLRLDEYTGTITYGWNTYPTVLAINFNATANNESDAGGSDDHKIGTDELVDILGMYIKGSYWSQFTTRTQSEPQAVTAYNAATGETVGTEASVTWRSDNNYMYRSSQDKVIRGYLDDGGQHASVNISDIPFAAYDLIIVCATDQDNRSFNPVTVNGTKYRWDAESGKTIAAESGTWGRCRGARVEYGLNAIKIDQMSARTLSIVGGANANNARGGIAAVLLVQSATGPVEIVGDTTMADLAAQLAGREDAIVTVVNDAAITQDGTTLGCSSLTLRADEPKTLSFVLTSAQLAAVAALAPNSTYDVATAIFGLMPTLANVKIAITNLPANRQIVYIGGFPLISSNEPIFTPANNTDWADRILPGYAKTIEAAGNMSFANDARFLQTIDSREITAAVVTDAPVNSHLYGLHAIDGGAGLGEITRDIYLKVTGGTPHLVSGGDDAGWNQAKTLPHGNLLVNVAGDALVDQIYGAGHRGGGGNNIDGHVGVVVEGDAQVRGPIAGGYSSIHNALPEVAGNTTVLIKNVQTHKESVVAHPGYNIDGWIFGGCAYLGNLGGGIIRGNTAVVIDLDETAEGVFAKPIVGGSYKGNDNNAMQVVGNSSVTITAPATVSFPENIVGGGHSTGRTSSVGGNASVTLNGGTYTGTITAGGDHANATVAGTATITVAGGDVTGATFVGGTATGAKTLNLNGGKVLLNNTTMTGFTTIVISPNAEVSFPDGWVANTPMTFDCETLNYNETTTGEVSLQTDITVGTTTIRNATLVYDLTNKAIYYSAQKSGNLRRRPDADLGIAAGNDDDPKRAWTYPDSWLDADDNIVSWPKEGASYVTIDADEVSSIRVDDRIMADMITLTNTAAQEAEPSFKFLTKEPLDEVATPKENPQYVILGKVSATGFGGDLYLQSRITQEIALGENTHIFFVAWVATEETTAYPYTFSNLLHPICKVGPGAFVVPSSMYTYAFNVKGGSLIYDIAEGTEATVSGVLQKDTSADPEAHLLIKRGAGAMLYRGADYANFLDGVEVHEGTFKLGRETGDYPFYNAEPTMLPRVRVKADATLDMNGKRGFKSYITLEEGATLANDGAGINDQQASIYCVELEGDATVRAKTSEFGILRNGHGDTKLELNGHTLTKVGTGDFYLTNTSGETGGTLKIAEGSFRATQVDSSLPEVTLEMADGTTLTRNATLTFKNVTLGQNVSMSGTADLTIADTLSFASDAENPIFTYVALTAPTVSYPQTPFTINFTTVPAETVTVPANAKVRVTLPDRNATVTVPVSGINAADVSVACNGRLYPLAQVTSDGESITAKGALVRENPVTGADISFINAFRGTTDANWAENANWYVIGEDCAWAAHGGTVAPMLAGSEDWSPSLIDGNLIENAANRAVTLDTLEGWGLKLGVMNGATVAVDHLTKIQSDGNVGLEMYVAVDATSKLTIGSIDNAKTATLDCFVAAPEGLVWNQAFSRGYTLNYHLAGEGTVAFAGAVTAGTHVFKHVEFALGDATKPVGICSKKLVSLSSASSVNFTLANDCTAKLLDAAEHQEVLAERSTSGLLFGSEALGTYILEKRADGVYVKYIGYTDNSEVGGPIFTGSGDHDWFADTDNWNVDSVPVSGDVLITLENDEDLELVIDTTSVSLNSLSVVGAGQLTLKTLNGATFRATRITIEGTIAIDEGVSFGTMPQVETTFLYEKSPFEMKTYGHVYTKALGTTDAPAVIPLNVVNGKITLTSATADDVYYIGDASVSATKSFVTFNDAKIVYVGGAGLGVGIADFVVSGGSEITAERFILSQGGNNRTANFLMKDSAKVTVTGTSIVDSNQSSIMFGHWNGPSTFTIQDSAKFIASEAEVLIGKTSNDHTINLEGGTLDVKGIKLSASANGTNTLNLRGGTLALGESGFGKYGSNANSLTINVEGLTTIQVDDGEPSIFFDLITTNTTDLTHALVKTGAGKLKLGLNRPRLDIRRGSVEITATPAERASGVLRLPVVENPTAVEREKIFIITPEGENVPIEKIELDATRHEVVVTLATNVITQPSRVSDWSYTLTGTVIIRNDFDDRVLQIVIDDAFPSGVTQIETIGKVEFVVTTEMADFGSVKLKINEESSVTLSGKPVLPFAEGIIGAGTIYFDPGEGQTLTVSKDNSGFTGTCVIVSGIVKMGHASAFGSGTGENKIYVNLGTTLDVNGLADASTKIVLNGGTVLNNGNKIDDGKKQFWQMQVDADSTIRADHEFGSIAQSYGALTYALNGHTLTKLGSSTYHLANATMAGGGVIDVQEGTLHIRNGLTVRADEALHLEIGKSGILDLASSMTLNGALTLGGVGTIRGFNNFPAAKALTIKSTTQGVLTFESAINAQTITFDMAEIPSTLTSVPLLRVSAVEHLPAEEKFVKPAGYERWNLTVDHDGCGYRLVKPYFVLIIK